MHSVRMKIQQIAPTGNRASLRRVMQSFADSKERRPISMLPHLGHEFVDYMHQHINYDEEVEFEIPLWLLRCQTAYIVAVCASAVAIFAFLLF
jgi:hypothetical protein